jgi:hypothetical protein
MPGITLSRYQANVFLKVEELLQTKGNLGKPLFDDTYVLQKKAVDYIIGNVPLNKNNSEVLADAELTYNHVVCIEAVSFEPEEEVAFQPTEDPSILGFHGPWPSEAEAWNYPNPMTAATIIAGTTPPSLRTVEWRGGFIPSFWDSDNSELTIPIGFYKILSKEGSLLDGFDTEFPNVDVFEVNQSGITLKNQFVPL